MTIHLRCKSSRNRGTIALVIATVISASCSLPAAEQPVNEFFEQQIRPLLIEKCHSCHGDKKQEGGLRLVARETILQGGDSGPAIVPGEPDQSLLVQAIRYGDELKMPPKGKLADSEIAALTRWIKLGAPWPGVMPQASQSEAGAFEFSAEHKLWWAYQPLQKLAPPVVANESWPHSEIDRFILAELESHNWSPADAASRQTLIRRATFDLTGLPPTPDEIRAFLDDDTPHAWARVVDRLLASPAHGQSWARRWLDVVRYADYHDGDAKARDTSCEPLQAWRYRDWVVNSLNNDLPFDQFVVHQIAGDLLPSPNGEEYYADGLVATTFLTNGSWDRGDADKEKMVSDMVDDQIDTIGKAFMGLTLGCARCHDHKFDPIAQADYYGLAGMFYSTRILQELGAKGANYTLQRIPLATKAYVAQRDEQLQQLTQIKNQLAALDKQSPKAPDDDPQRQTLVQQLDKLQGELLPEPPLAEAASDGGTPGGLFPGIQDVPMHIRGSYTRLGPVVPRHLPTFFVEDSSGSLSSGSGRHELAQWIASAQNPLTARVIVNRVWQSHFGVGLVQTANNFGLLSEPPSHPELLDWLAVQFIEDDWSLKELHRRIMLSATYQQSSVVAQNEIERDPENRWLGRFTPRRLEAEAIRDAVLSATGRLDLSLAGPATADIQTPRRSLYVQTARWDRSNFATLFDAANPDASTEQRVVSTVAPQALFLLNNEFTLAQAKYLGERMARDIEGGDEARIRNAYLRLFGRDATAEELEIAQAILGQSNGDQAWTDLAHVLLCSNEFVYVD